MSGLPPFPRRSDRGPVTPPRVEALGFRLRHATDEDLPRLRDLYADTRADEVAAVPWPAMAKRSFLDHQFELQHRHYLVHYADAQFLVVEQDGLLQGRYYLQRGTEADLIVDISLVAACRGRGVGRALIEASQREAATAGRGMTLHVVRANVAARRLYERLGFQLAADDGGTHLRMDWAAPGA
ncbi:GNAT family N-acetyltransferase [Arenimonas sp.]|uniref:GNAT family N-acetyltransferase n=1 Tax=Arenimonas sp. TaxID=1872635 RepID=UPI002E376C96|nr:GNAT family N-acetyltransferase [Arenimonas sp.]HEX4853080.1 GNAT family N-acetyltransferase [Arenimonas sp.]